MHILCLGLNHRTAGVSLRERLAFSEEDVRATLGGGRAGRNLWREQLSELVLLSTCNRVELYAVAARVDFLALEELLCKGRGVPLRRISRHFYRLADREAVAHLLRVAAGLDSLVLGEAQILGQALRAYELAQEQDAAGPVLARLFQSALRAGKRARSETAIGQNPASIASVAVRLAGQAIPDLTTARVAVLGAGEMAELAVEALRKRGAAQLRVINRSPERARQLAERWNACAATFERLAETLVWADVVIASAGARCAVLSLEAIAQSLPRRGDRPLVIVDIALPRNVDPRAGELAGVCLFDLDALQERLGESLARRSSQVPQVEAILAEVEEEFWSSLALLEVVPLIAEMHRRAESIRTLEVERTLRRLPSLSEAERERVNALTRSLVKKILHTPITRLRSAAGSPQAGVYAEAARELFGLPENPSGGEERSST